MNKKLLIFYCIFLFSFSIFSYLFVDKNLIYLSKFYSGFSFLHRNIVSLIYLTFISSFFGFYVLILWKIKNKKFNIPYFKKIVLLTFVFLFFSYPAVLSYDIFNYQTTAKLLYFHHENPYIIMPTELRQDPQLLFTHAANKTTLYGPIWILLTSLPYFLSFNNFIINIFLFKLINLGFYLLALFTIWKISKNLFSLAFFALNPLVVIEIFVSNHNDIAMMSLVLFSLYLFNKSKLIFGIFIFLFSILIKYATIALLPVILYFLWKNLLGKKVNIKPVLFVSFWLMFVVFLISPLREEMYPWYAIWFLVFSCFFSDKTTFMYLIVALSFGLMLRYLPFMYSGTYFGLTPLLRVIFTVTPILFTSVFLFFKKKLCLKELFYI